MSESRPSASPDKPPSRAGWVLYDNSCGWCGRWVSTCTPTLKRRGFQVVPLQSRWVQEQLVLSETELMRDMHLLLPDGTMVRGAEAYRYILRRIWWAHPVYLLSLVPGLRQLFDWTYRSFANRRHAISNACNIHPPRATNG